MMKFIKLILFLLIMSNTQIAAAIKTEGLPGWDLTDLYASDADAEKDISQLSEKVNTFVKNYKGNLASGDAAIFLNSINDYEVIKGVAGRIGTYAFLQYTVDMQNSEKSTFFQDVQEQLNQIFSPMVFYSLEVNEIEDSQMKKMLEDKGIAKYHTMIEEVRKMKPYQLSEKEEVIMNKKGITSNSAWSRLFDELMADLKFEVNGKEYTTSTLMELLSDRDEEVRKAAYLEFSKVLDENLRTLTLITNTLAKDKQISDELRGVKDVMKMRNLSNNIEDEVVDALLSSVKSHYPKTSHRYYAIKAKILGKEKLAFWDRNAPWPSDSDRLYEWEEAKQIVMEAYSDFSPKMADVGQKFFDNPWIDVPPRDGKRFGAFAHPAVSSVHPYLMLNYQGKIRDVMTLAHELGHGVHQYLSADQGDILSGTPLTLAETASVFAEQLTFRKILAQVSKEDRVVILASKIEDMLNTVVRQVAFCLFEKELHNARRKGELTADEIAEIWMKTQKEALGDAFDLSEEYRNLWSYVPHFIHSPFYVYAYAFGDCLVNSLYMEYIKADDRKAFADKYLEMLSKGGSENYKVLLADFGLDPRSETFWSGGLQMIEDLIDELEGLL